MSSNAVDVNPSLRPNGLEVGNPASWNNVFTNLLRKNRRYAWGNWSLDPVIRPGRVGYFNATDNVFNPVVLLEDVPVERLASPVDWDLESEDVTHTSMTVEFEGGYKDPTSGDEVNVGLASTWKFGSAGAIMSRGSSSAELLVPNAPRVMQERYDDIYAAAPPEWVNEEGIVQGFGMITRVWTCLGCINLGAVTESSEFTLIGSIDGVMAMEGGDASFAAKGSYKNTRENGTLEKFLYPNTADTTSPQEIAYAYEFATFDGQMVLSQWVGDVSTLTLTLSNTGSYIVDCTVTYDVPFEKDQKATTTISGGMDRSITGIPIDASNIQIALDFRFGTPQFLRVERPLNGWYLGQGWIELSGWWPWNTGAKWL